MCATLSAGGPSGDVRRSLRRLQIPEGLRSQGIDDLTCPRSNLTKMIATILGLNRSAKKNEIQMGRRNDHSQRFIVVAEEFVADFHQQFPVMIFTDEAVVAHLASPELVGGRDHVDRLVFGGPEQIAESDPVPEELGSHAKLHHFEWVIEPICELSSLRSLLDARRRAETALSFERMAAWIMDDR